MSEPNTLLLKETGVARLPDGTEAVNVGPIVAALGYLTEGRGEDRGTDEQGTPLPDLLSLAFDVVQAVILGGRQADYLRDVKRDFDARFELDGRASLALAKHAAKVRHSAPSSALERAATDLRVRLRQLEELSIDEASATTLRQAVEGFQGFGADRWVTATSHLLIALGAVEAGWPSPEPRRRASQAPVPRPEAVEPARRRPKTKTKPKTKPKTKTTVERSARKSKKKAVRRNK